ncbi:MAG: DUF1501 domain-containing protein [Planctomycetota bacterium]|nr:DUF1501 domain-containing protein [Planctomycetota bacterium]MEE3298540.1 DUF1501 domain-containing protein [Planctomycetota bacterium]
MFSISESTPYGRRDFLKIGSLALGGLGLSNLDAAAATSLRKKSVVLLFLQGGPPQIETFDPKPDGQSEIRSVTGKVKTSLPGVYFGGGLPKMASLAHKMAVVRSFKIGAAGGSHENGYTALLNGLRNPFDATMGSLYSRAAGSLNPDTGIPTNSIILPETIDPDIKLGTPSGAFTYNQTRRYFCTPGKLGSEFQPFDPAGGGQLMENLKLSVPRKRFDDRRELLSKINRLRRELEKLPGLKGTSTAQQQAYDVLFRGISEAFDLSKEDPKVLEQYDTSKLVPMKMIRRGGPWYRNNFNRTTNLLGKQMLLARRLCEAGCGFVTVVDSCWDFHNDGNNPPVKMGMDALSPQLDHAVAAFLEDVESRGLSDEILLVITSEMGRTPKKDKGGGSGHWGNLAPLVLAGGGLQMGQVIGRSDRIGGNPSSTPYTPEHLMATVLQTLFDVSETRLRTDLPAELSQLITDGNPIRELF